MFVKLTTTIAPYSTLLALPAAARALSQYTVEHGRKRHWRQARGEARCGVVRRERARDPVPRSYGPGVTCSQGDVTTSVRRPATRVARRSRARRIHLVGWLLLSARRRRGRLGAGLAPEAEPAVLAAGEERRTAPEEGSHARAVAAVRAGPACMVRVWRAAASEAATHACVRHGHSIEYGATPCYVMLSHATSCYRMRTRLGHPTGPNWRAVALP